MIKRHQDKASHIVEAFKGSLDVVAREGITDAQLNGLEMMIGEAMGEEMAVAAEMVLEVVTKLRAESEKPDLGL